MQSYGQPYSAGSAVEARYGGFWIRVGAYIIDAIVLAVINGILSAIVRSTGATYAISTVVGAVYFIAFWMNGGRTLGYRVTGLQLVRADGAPITFGTALIRYIGLIVSFVVIFIGVLWVIWDPRKQTWADKMADTLVIRV